MADCSGAFQHPVETGEGRGGTVARRLEIDGVELQRHERSELVDPVVEPPQRVVQVSVAGGGQRLRALDVVLRPWLRQERDGEEKSG